MLGRGVNSGSMVLLSLATPLRGGTMDAEQWGHMTVIESIEEFILPPE